MDFFSVSDTCSLSSVSHWSFAQSENLLLILWWRLCLGLPWFRMPVGALGSPSFAARPPLLSLSSWSFPPSSSPPFQSCLFLSKNERLDGFLGQRRRSRGWPSVCSVAHPPSSPLPARPPPTFRSASYSFKMCRFARGLKHTVSWRFSVVTHNAFQRRVRRWPCCNTTFRFGALPEGWVMRA